MDGTRPGGPAIVVSLTPEERQRIYEEEKQRLEIRQRLESENARIKELDAAIGRLTQQGYVLVSRDNTTATAQLRKPKRFNAGYAVLNWLVLSWVFGLGIALFILQCILHAAAKDEVVNVAYEGDGVYIKSRGYA